MTESYRNDQGIPLIGPTYWTSYRQAGTGHGGQTTARAPRGNGSLSSICLTKGRGPDISNIGRLDAGTFGGGAGKPGRLAGTGEGLLADKEHPWTLERARSAGQVMCVGVQSARQGEGLPEVNTCTTW